MARILWNKYEAALLLDYYYKIESGQIDRKRAIKEISNELRLWADINNLKIDDKYRNENGINLQLESMTFIVTCGESGINRSSKLFENIVKIYNEDIDSFNIILDKAKSREFD